MQTLVTQKYILRNAASRRKSREYAQKILRVAKNVDITEIQNQLDLIYNNIDIEICADNLRRLRQNTSINDLLVNINKFKHN